MPADEEVDLTGMLALSKFIQFRLKQNYDAFMCVSGGEGEGKSSLAMRLCQMVNPTFNIEENVIYEMSEMGEKIFTLPRYSAVLVDEGIQGFYKRTWQQQGRAQMNVIFALCRMQNLFFVLCIPRIGDLDEMLRNHRIMYWLHVKTRGVANFYFKDPDQMIDDPWHLKDEKLRRKKCQHLGLRQVYFPKMDQRIENEYIRIKKSNFDIVRQQFEDKVNQPNGKSTKKDNKFKMERDYTIGQTFKALGISANKYAALINKSPVFVNNVIREQKVNEIMKS